MTEKCFYCGTPMINGACPDCGYYYPFDFECPYRKGMSCNITKRTCNKRDFYKCDVWKQASYNE